MKIISVDKDDVGKRISTKKVGRNEREVITDLYKPKEGNFYRNVILKKQGR